jgi:hypothetical protein
MDKATPISALVFSLFQHEGIVIQSMQFVSFRSSLSALCALLIAVACVLVWYMGIGWRHPRGEVACL